MFNGIDVAHHQQNIDWPKVKAAGKVFAMIKATEGVGYVDPNFKTYVAGATAAGLHIGAYHFLRAGDAKEQARQCVAAIAPYQWDYPVALDVEHAELLKLTTAQRTDMIIAFCDVIRAAGYYPVIYTGYYWAKNYLDMARLKNIDLWLARYNTVPGYDGISMWQYSSVGRIAGISGNVDLDYSYKDYPSIIAQLHTAVKIDTTMDIVFPHGQFYTVKTTCGQPVTVTAGTDGVVTVVPFPRTGNEQLFALVAVGESGQETGIYTAAPGEKPTKRFVYKIK